ncbi:helix-turn-helix domain-containing protein [Butyrivibrio sp. MC2013]|uniref:helix-turn-helix domain-containing protein n=1 Tax=Butyrivibrio sp. MC2013 TaxID=1280686 RepID=UPI0009DBBF17|nr:helix-turn-helix transcriptional regulator [Butyrivibrio sp. MC2013]
MEDIKVFIGSNIKKARIKKKMTQMELANDCFTTNTVISAYENGKKMPSLDTIANISRALDVSIDSLYFGSEENAIITRPAKKGRKIVNCFKYLFDQSIIGSSGNREGYSKLYITRYLNAFSRLYNNLLEYKNTIDLYPDQEAFLEMLLEKAGNEIDKIDDDKAASERRDREIQQLSIKNAKCL